MIFLYTIEGSEWFRKMRHHHPQKTAGSSAGKNSFQTLQFKYGKDLISWIKHYLVFNGKRHPADMSAIEMEQFLTYLDTLKKGTK